MKAGMEVRKILSSNPTLEVLLEVSSLVSLLINEKENKPIIRFLKKPEVFQKMLDYVCTDPVPYSTLSNESMLIIYLLSLLVFIFINFH